MKKPIKNPIAAMVQPLAGQKLPDNFMQETANFGGTYDKRDLSQLWKNPNWSGKSGSENLIQDARLTTWKDVIGEK